MDLAGIQGLAVPQKISQGAKADFGKFSCAKSQKFREFFPRNFPPGRAGFLAGHSPGWVLFVAAVLSVPFVHTSQTKVVASFLKLLYSCTSPLRLH